MVAALRGATMTSYPFVLLDVFAERLGDGNPLAVVVDAGALDSGQMQRIARWTNLAETAFLLPPSAAEADYRVRIFTTQKELPFAGHPSVGAAYVAQAIGRVDPRKARLTQECAAGLLPVAIEGQGDARRVHVQAPAATVNVGVAGLATALADALSPMQLTAAAQIDNGPRWLVAEASGAQQVRLLQPDMGALLRVCRAHGAVGVGVFGRAEGPDADLVVRGFCPGEGMPEDPVTGSLNAAIGSWLDQRNQWPVQALAYRASQGREVGCDGQVEVRRDRPGGAISIGGHCRISLRGQLDL